MCFSIISRIGSSDRKEKELPDSPDVHESSFVLLILSCRFSSRAKSFSSTHHRVWHADWRHTDRVWKSCRSLSPDGIRTKSLRWVDSISSGWQRQSASWRCHEFSDLWPAVTWPSSSSVINSINLTTMKPEIKLIYHYCIASLEMNGTNSIKPSQLLLFNNVTPLRPALFTHLSSTYSKWWLCTGTTTGNQCSVCSGRQFPAACEVSFISLF